MPIEQQAALHINTVPEAPTLSTIGCLLAHHLSSCAHSAIGSTTCPTSATSIAYSLKHLSCRLILDARNLGKTFTDIAKMLPARNVTTLRKHYAIISKPKVLLMCLYCLQPYAVLHGTSSHGCIAAVFMQACTLCNKVFTLQAPAIKKPSPPASANPSPVAAATASLQSVAAAAVATAATAAASGATALETTSAAGRQPSPAASKPSPALSETVEVDYRWVPAIKHCET